MLSIRFTSVLFLAATAVSASLPAAEATDVGVLLERLKTLESQVENMRRRLGEDAPTKPASTLAVAQGKEARLAIGGYIQAHTEFGDAPDARFSPVDRVFLRRARMGVKGTFAEHFDFTLQSDFSNNAIGGVTAYRAQITDCVITWNRYSAANLSLGQFKTPYGYEQLVPDTKLPMAERSLPNDQLTLSRQIGGTISGTILNQGVTYSVGFFNGNGVNNGANDNDQFLYVGRVTGTILQGTRGRLAVGGGAFTTRDNGNFVGRREGVGLDAQASLGPWELQTEYLRTHYDRVVGRDTKADGWSVIGLYMVVPKTLQASVRYEVFDPNRAIASDDTDLWTVGCNYFIKGDDLKLSINYVFGRPPAPLLEQRRLLTRLQVIF